LTLIGHPDISSGGSILADFLKQEESPIKNARITAVVRSADQAEKIAKLGVKVVKLNFADEKAVEETILSQESRRLSILRCAGVSG
jgi:saccharopine dehydrogenase-like NADP-dependent oxidoreductase